MSDREVTVPLVDALTLSTGSVTKHHAVGALDTSGFSPEFADIAGFLSLPFFAETPFTVDYARGAVVLESPATLDERVRNGVVAAVRIEREGPSIGAFLLLDVPRGRTIEVEIDMGSDSLILDRTSPRRSVWISRTRTSAASRGATRRVTDTPGTSRGSRASSA
jgi:hypothetical protein